MDKLNFSARINSGIQIYACDECNNISIIVGEDNKYYLRFKLNNEWMYPEWMSDGFSSLDDAIQWLCHCNISQATADSISLNNEELIISEDFQLGMSMLGFQLVDSYQSQTMLYEYTKKLDDKLMHILVWYYMGQMFAEVWINGVKLCTPRLSEPTEDTEVLVNNLETFLLRYNVDIISSVMISDTINRSNVITAAINTKNLAKDMIRVKSSNVWAYNINVKDKKSKFGDVLVQFKGPDGGPGDIYIYYDVPVLTYRRWHSAPSKGHYFWQYIRNFFKYSKLTGDKRGKLHNAVN